MRSFEYRNGYFHALLDLQNYYSTHSDSIGLYRAAQHKVILAVVKLLLENGRALDQMMETGGNLDVLLKKDKAGITAIWKEGDTP